MVVVFPVIPLKGKEPSYELRYRRNFLEYSFLECNFDKTHDVVESHLEDITERANILPLRKTRSFLGKQRLGCLGLRSEIYCRSIEILLDREYHHCIFLDVGFRHTYHPSYSDPKWIVVYIANDLDNLTEGDFVRNPIHRGTHIPRLQQHKFHHSHR